MITKNIFYAWVSNDSGTSEDVLYSRGNSKSNAKAQARRQYGAGWKVHIMEVSIDGDGQSEVGADEVETFTLRR